MKLRKIESGAKVRPRFEKLLTQKVRSRALKDGRRLGKGVRIMQGLD